MSRSYTFAGLSASIPLLLMGFSQPLAAQSAPTMLLPGGALNQASTPGVTVILTPNYSPGFIQFLATFDGVPNGYSIGNTTYNGWCVDPFSDFASNPAYNLISTYDTAKLNNPPGGGKAQNPNWGAVNWVLNHKPATGDAPTWIVQQVIWKLLTGQYIAFAPGGGDYPAPPPAPFTLSSGDSTIANNLYTAALAQTSFVPGPGQVAGLMLYIDGINPDGTSTISNNVVSQNNINPNGPPLNGLNGQPNKLQEILVEVPVGPGSIGDFVWQDTNQNGIQDAGEPGIDGVSVNLCADSSCNTVLATTTTANHAGNDGYYQFTGLPLGTYYVSIDTSQAAISGPGLVPTLTGQGTPATDSNLNPSQVILTSGTPVDETIDFGFTSPGASAIGDFVWQDNNGNGIQDSGEPGLSGLTVNLCSDVNCNTILRTTTTDQNGAYHFTGLFAGIYYVQVVTGPGFTATTPQAGFPANQASDSGGNVAGVPTEVNLPINFTDNTIDFGFIPPAQGAIGDFVFLDLNSNGIQDAGDVGINNVTLRLYDSSNNVVGTTTTVTNSGQDGYYQFTGLPAGSYTVKVDATTLPPTYTPTVSNAPGSTPANDSNGSPAPVTLATNLSVDETIDFGYVAPCTGVIGDFVWNDVNGNGIQDSGEPGIPNVIVNLYGPNHVFITSTTTDANGAYHFNGLCAGSYTVEVVPPAGYTASPSKQGGNPATDSNGSPAPVTLTEDNTTDNTIDFGYYQLTVTCSSVTAGTQGIAFNSGPMTVTGGALPYTFSIVGGLGNLPAGLTLDSTTGAVSGTPTASGTFSIQVTDASGAVGTSCAITINPPLSVTCSSTTAGTQGVAFNSGPMNVTGGTLPYTFSIATGSLPNGLSLNTSTGAVTGTPTAPGSFSIQVTDANGAVGTSCAITINPPLSVTCSTTTTGTQGVAFNSGPMNVTGGTTPYTFSIVGTLPAGLTLNTTTGAVTGTPTASGTFSIQVTDASGAAGTNCAITINPPLSVTCSTTTTGTQGVPFNSGPMNVTGGTTPYTFSIVGPLPGGLTLNTTTGAVTGTPTASGTFSIQVTDANGAVGTNCAITINPPPTVTCSTTTSGEVGVAFNSGAITVAGGTAPFTFSIATGSLPNGLSLNTSTGAVTGTPTAPGSFSIRVTDANGAVGANCAITINPPPTVTCSTTNSGEVGLAFNSPAMTVTGGTSPYTFSVATGTLPSGLTLNASTGAITGTPTAAGTFTIQVRDANGVVATGTCPFTIVPPPTVTCSTTNSGEVGLAFNSPAMTVTGGTAPYTFSVATGSLPNGLTLNATTGAITGTPTAAGTFTIQVKDANGVVATGTCPFTIVPPPTVTCSTTNSGEVGLAFNSPAMTVTGGAAPYTFSIATGSLPNGLTLNASTGAITGTPTSAGTFTIKVTDGHGLVATGTCPFTIIGGPSLTCPAVSSGLVGVAFSSPAMTVTGGTGPYKFSVGSGSLPTGLTLNASTGAITGTPLGAGSFTIKVTDANGAVATTTCPFTFIAPPLVSCATGTATVGIPYSSNIPVTGGSGSFTFSLSAGSLPPGLNLNPSTGAITGTPTAAGTSGFTVKVVDNVSGAVAYSNCASSCTSGGSTVNVNTYSVLGNLGNSHTYSVNGTSLIAYGLNNNGTPTALYAKNESSTEQGLGIASDSEFEINTSTFVQLDVSQLVAAGFTNAQILFTSVQAGESWIVYGSNTLGVLGTKLSGPGNTAQTLIAMPGYGTWKYIGITAGYKNIDIGALAFTSPATKCSITVTAAPISVTCASGTAQVGVPYSSNVPVTGGSGSFTFSISAGALPPGLNLNPSNGAITGTPTTAGSSGFTVKVVDNVTGTVAFSACTSSCSGGGSAVTVDINSALGSLGNSHVYSVNGTSLTAYGFNNNGTPTALYAKNQGPTEHGLGIDADSDNEINTSTFIQLDVSQLVAAGFTNAQISFSSVQAGESYIIYGSNTLGTLGTKLSGPGSVAETLIAMPGYGTWKYIGITAGKNNIDIGGLAFTSPPTTCNITVAPAAISSGDAATIGFWHNKNGQALILSLNGGPNSQNLANLLAGQLPYLYGAKSSNDLTGQGNDDVAQLFLQFFNVSGQKTNAQIMACALATYVTSSTVAGTNAVQYGFNSSPGGTGLKTYNVGANGTAMGLVNNQSYTVLQLLQQANLTTANGTFNANAFNTVFNGINTTGDIM